VGVLFIYNPNTYTYSLHTEVEAGNFKTPRLNVKEFKRLPQILEVCSDFQDFMGFRRISR
jgi:hypothetical protein